MTDSRPRTAAANDAWRERGAHSAAMKLVPRVAWLSDEDLRTLTELFIVQCTRRGVQIPNPFATKEDERHGM